MWINTDIWDELKTHHSKRKTVQFLFSVYPKYRAKAEPALI